MDYSEENMIHCNDCNKTFPSSDALKEHMVMHAMEKPYICKYCGYATLHKSLYSKHIKHHAGEKPYQCSECEENFATASNLNAHMKMAKHKHRSYKCSHCWMIFSQNSDLRNHIIIHTGEKFYKCDKCTETFSDLGVLKSHMKTHTDKKKYQCNYCDKSFEHNRDLLRHMNKNMQKHMRIKNNKLISKPKDMQGVIKESNSVLSYPQINVKAEVVEKVDESKMTETESSFGCEIKTEVNRIQRNSKDSNAQKVDESNIKMKEEKFYIENNKANDLSKLIYKIKEEPVDTEYIYNNNQAVVFDFDVNS